VTVHTPTTVTFLFTDIEGSTRLWERLPAVMGRALDRHDRILEDAIAGNHGIMLKHTGDGVIAVFDDPAQAVAAAVDAQRAIKTEPWPEGTAIAVRMAINSGQAERRGNDYFGPALNQAARMLEAAHGGQVLVSSAVPLVTVPAGVGLRNLGQHRLRDLSEPVLILQVTAPGLPVMFPPLTTLDTIPNNLPTQITEFVGRAEQVEALTTTLGEHRLVTVGGVGGVGKSRLAVQVAARMLDRFRDGVWLVELASLSEPGMVVKAVAQTIAVREDSVSSLIDVVAERLRHDRVLLIVDNCEHLIDEVATVVDRLLRRCPELHVLATSREALGIAGEQLRQVQPLLVPPADAAAGALLDYESVALFVDRARAVTPGFEIAPGTAAAVIEICRRLDGIPLALELAAARLRVLSVNQVAERLDDRFRLLTGGSRTALPRHRTLQATMDWSHELLDERQRVVFRRLAVFQGGFDLAAVEAVASDGLSAAGETVEALGRLVDESLVLAEGVTELRYRMLETVRQYSQDRLADSGESDQVRRRHAEWIASITDRAEDGLRGSLQLEWVERLRRERDNILAALAWTSEADPDLGLRIATGLGHFWYLFGPYAQGERWLRSLLAATSGPSIRRAMALRWQAALLLTQGRYEEASRVAEEAIAVAEVTGDPTIEAICRLVLAIVADYRGKTAEAARLYRESYADLDELAEGYWASIALTNLESHVRKMGDPVQSQRLAEELLAQARAQGDGRLMGLGHTALAVNALHRGDEAEFTSQIETALADLGATGQAVWRTRSLIHALHTAVLTGHPRVVDRFREDVRRLTLTAGGPEATLAMHLTLGMDATFRGNWAAADAEFVEAIRLAGVHGAHEAKAEALSARAMVALGRDDPAAALLLAGKAVETAESIGARVAELSALNALALANLAAGNLDAAGGLATRAVRLAAGSQEMLPLIRSAETLGAVAAGEGDDRHALRLLASAAGFRQRLHLVRTGPEEHRYQASLDRVRHTLGDEVVEDLWEQSCSTELSDLVTCCLEPVTSPA
jgi:predicted ATPase/class 3 adenylate cyclase